MFSDKYKTRLETSLRQNTLQVCTPEYLLASCKRFDAVTACICFSQGPPQTRGFPGGLPRSSQGLPRVFQRSSKGLPRVFQGSSKGLPRVFQGSSKTWPSVVTQNACRVLFCVLLSFCFSVVFVFFVVLLKQINKFKKSKAKRKKHGTHSA